MKHDHLKCDCDQKVRRMVELSHKTETTLFERNEMKFLQYCLDKDRVCV